MARGGFPGMPGGNMQQMLKQAQRMQANIAKLQEELEAREYEASAGGGMVNVRANGKKELLSIEETHGILKKGNGAFVPDENGTLRPLDVESLVSMNFWGFTPDFIDELATGFEDFLGSLSDNALKAEYLLPTIVDQLLKEKRVDLAVLPSMDHWFGVTFKEDVPCVREAFQDLVSRGVYPEKLFPRNL